MHDGAEGAGGHFVFEFVLLVQAQDVLVIEIPFAGHEGVPSRGADAAVGPFYELTLCPRCPFQGGNFRTLARQGAVCIDLLEGKHILSIGTERAFKLKQVAAGFCRFVLPAVEEVDFLRPVHQPVRVVGVNGLALVAAGQPPHVPQIEGDEALGQGGFGQGAFVAIQEENPFVVQRAGFDEPHDLQPCFRFAQQINSLRLQAVEHHAPRFFWRGQNGVVGLKPPNEPGAVHYFLPTDACPWVAFFFRTQCIAQSLHPCRQGRKERGDLVGEQRLQRVEKGVNGAARQLGQLVQGHPGPLLGGHLVQYPRGVNLKTRIGIAGTEERLTQCLPDVIVVP